MVDLEAIRGAAILEGLAPSHVQALAGVAVGREARVGERLFQRGEAAETVYIVRSGVFALTVGLRRLGSVVELAVEEKVPGDALGWSALVEPRESIYSCFCTTKGSLLAFPRAELEALLSSDPELGRRFTANLSRLIGERVRVLQDLWIDEVQQSMARIHYWTHRDVTNQFADAVKVGREGQRRPRRFFGRGRTRDESRPASP